MGVIRYWRGAWWQLTRNICTFMWLLENFIPGQPNSESARHDREKGFVTENVVIFLMEFCRPVQSRMRACLWVALYMRFRSYSIERCKFLRSFYSIAWYVLLLSIDLYDNSRNVVRDTIQLPILLFFFLFMCSSRIAKFLVAGHGDRLSRGCLILKVARTCSMVLIRYHQHSCLTLLPQKSKGTFGTQQEFFCCTWQTQKII